MLTFIGRRELDLAPADRCATIRRFRCADRLCRLGLNQMRRSRIDESGSGAISPIK
ncbi:hypothetical protein [Neoaquamicrobium sediminum]|uniref:Uncharacterized protein n=1 Tax=Neoaquamicrobium sediminum TaxID=1849104 RepID=A0ABV3WNE0_9HYPH